VTDDVVRIGQELRSLRLAQDMSGGATFVIDPDLRVVSANGPDLAEAGIDGHDLVGRRLEEILAPDSPASLLAAYRSALAGQEADVEFVEEASGRLFHVEIRPLRGADDEVIGAVARSDDLSSIRAQQTHFEHIASMHVVGVSTYDLRSGWRHDACALELLGLDDPMLEADQVIERAVLPDDRAAMAASWARLALHGGRDTLTFRVGAGGGPDHPVGLQRRIQSTLEVLVGKEGQLLRVISTHVDVTASVTASAELEQAQRQAHADRLALVRDVSAVLTSSMLPVAGLLKAILDVAVAALGGGAWFAETSPDGLSFTHVAVSAEDPGAADRLLELWADPSARPIPDLPLLREVLETGVAVTSIDDPDWVARFEKQAGQLPVADMRHVIIVPVRSHARVVGLLSLLRTEEDKPYRPDDLDLAQILADRAGAAIAAELALQSATKERDRRLATNLLLEDARAQRHRLVERLSATETRERRILAEAVHDEPIQLIAAARLRVMALQRRLDAERTGETNPPRAPIADETARIGKILETAMERLRLLIVALSPPDLEDGLVAALVELADTTFSGTQTVVTCLGPESLPLTAAQEGAALLIVREALVNVRQHANATRVVVRVSVGAAYTVLRVDDDGIGAADIGPRKGHLGMVSMRARAEDAGGQLTVDSKVSVGTSVVLTFPVPH